MADVTFPDAVEYYSRVAGDFHESYGSDPNRLERLRVWRDFFERYVRDASFAYDIGCGSGVITAELARHGPEVVGIDGAEGMLAVAEANARVLNWQRISFQRHLLPLADPTSFRVADVIISSSVLEYLDSLPDALRSLHRMLRPQGVLIFSVSNHDSLSRKAVRCVHALTGRPAYLRYLRHFATGESLRRDLQSAGFSPLEQRYFSRSDRINRLLGLALPARWSSNMLIVAAQRN